MRILWGTNWFLCACACARVCVCDKSLTGQGAKELWNEVLQKEFELICPWRWEDIISKCKQRNPNSTTLVLSGEVDSNHGFNSWALLNLSDSEAYCLPKPIKRPSLIIKCDKHLNCRSSLDITLEVDCHLLTGCRKLAWARSSRMQWQIHMVMS